MNLSIVILNYKTKDLTVSCLESIVKLYKQELINSVLEIIIVDNGSADDSLESIKYYVSSSKYKNIKIIGNEENVGFAKGCNIGEGLAKGKYILFLNSDTEVKDRGFLKMVEFLENNQRVGILGGKLLNINGSSQPSAGKFYTLFNLFFMLAGLGKFFGIRKSPNTISKVDWVSGGCMMVKKSLFKKLSGFDESYFMYIEDMDLCFRANKLEFATYFYPDVKVFHKELGSGNRSFAVTQIYKGLLYFYKKHKSYFEYVVARILLKIKASVAIIVGIITNNSSLTKTYRMAIRF